MFDVSVLAGFFIIATLIEGIIEYAKPAWDPTKREGMYEMYAGAVVGILIAVLSGLDLFAALGVPLGNIEAVGPWAGIVLTGFFIGRGANYMHKIVQALPSS